MTKCCSTFIYFFVTFSSNLSEIHPVVVEDLDAVCAIVGDENLLAVVHHHAVRELKVLRAAKLVQHVAHLEKKDANYF